MHRLLIVDDMPIIVNDMADMFAEEEQLELEIFRAFSPHEAIGIMNNQKIDIVLSDIRMPGLSGFDLIKEIHIRWPRCKVIFLTSYHDFQYVKEAISLGGFEYILKTEGDDAIIQAVRKAIQALQDEWSMKDVLEKSLQRLSLAKPSMQKDLLLNTIVSGFSSKEDQRSQFNLLELKFDLDCPVFIMISRIDSWKETLNYSNRELFNYAIQNVMEEYFNNAIHFQSISYDRYNVVWILQPLHSVEKTGKEWNRMFRFIYGTLETAQFTCREMLKLQVSFIIHSDSVAWEKLPSTFHSLDMHFHRGIGLNTEILITDEELEKVIEEQQEPVTDVRCEVSRIQYAYIQNMSEFLKKWIKSRILQIIR